MQVDQSDLTSMVIDKIDYAGDDEVISWQDIRESLKHDGDIRSFQSNIPTLDSTLQGFQPGELIAVSGLRKSGKTLLCQSIDRGFWKSSIRSLWLQYEVTPRQFAESFPDGVGLDMTFAPKKMKAHVLQWARDRILEAIAKYGISVVFIDHLHFLFDMGRIRNASLEVGQVIRYLKYLAVELNIVIILLCHLRKTELDKEPTDMDFRDSSLISQESDVGLLIWRVKDNDNQAWLKVCYSRRTGTWEKKIPLAKQQNGLLAEVVNV